MPTATPRPEGMPGAPTYGGAEAIQVLPSLGHLTTKPSTPCGEFTWSGEASAKMRRLFAATYSVFISKSVQIGDIPASLDSDSVRTNIRDEYLRDSTVTVV
jgi:hypothetical protein